MPVIPSLMERTYMLRLNRGPGPMLDLFGGMAIEAAMTAGDLGVFEALAEQPATPATLADRLEVSEAGMAVLLSFLSTAGYVTEEDGRYRPTRMTTTWFRESSPRSYRRYFRFWRAVLVPFWREHARAALETGEPPRSVYDWLDDHPELWPVAQDAFELTADLIGDDVAAEVDLPAGGRLLDVGGGHARYSVAFCEANPSLSATVLDAPENAALARENVADAGLEDRIEFRAADYESDPLGEGYDAALLFNVIHGNDPATNRDLVETVAGATTDDATLAVLDHFGDRSRPSIVDTGTRFLDLTYFVSLGGRTYETATVADWLAEAGFEVVDTRPFRDRNSTLLVAEKV